MHFTGRQGGWSDWYRAYWEEDSSEALWAVQKGKQKDINKLSLL